MKRIFSGIQPSGLIHLGNYFGSIKNWADFTKEYESFFCLVDLHALTVYQKPEKLRKNTLKLAKILLATGVDPKKCTLFVQSHLPEHAELCWILGAITPIAELERMTQFKSKAKKHKKNINAGLFNYPVLMAADILLYRADIIPVGEDQIQHLELTKTIANKFNNLYGQTFKIPNGFVPKHGARIMGLDDPSQKMSKSAASEYNYIAFSDSPEMIKKKIMKAVTDSGSEIKYSKEKPAISNLLTIYHLVSNEKIQSIEKKYAGAGYGEFKKDLAEKVIEFIEPIQKNMKKTTNEQVLDILEKGAAEAKKTAGKSLAEIKEKIGLLK